MRIIEKYYKPGAKAYELLVGHSRQVAQKAAGIAEKEKIICYADKFFSKNGTTLPREKSLDQVIQELKNYGSEQVGRFLEWHQLFA